MKTLLAIDAATTAGFCVGEPGQTPRLGTLRLPKDCSLGWFLKAYSDWLKDAFNGFAPVGQVVYEAPFVQNVSAVERLYGLMAATELLCSDAGIPCQRVHIGEWKSYFLGSAQIRRAEAKRRCIDLVRERGLDPRNDNEADAYGLWEWKIHSRKPELALRHARRIGNLREARA